MTWALHFSLAPTLFEPAETPGVVSPFMILYALHDAMVKPMPGKAMAPSLAESWSVVARRARVRVRAAQGRALPQRRPGDRGRREVLLRALPRHLREDAQGQGGRGRDAGPRPRPLPAQAAVAGLHDLLRHARRRARAGWSRRSTSSAWARTGFKKAPVGAGPYRFVSFTPGVELVLEAADGYWRKTPSVKRLVFKSVPGRRHAAGHAQARRRGRGLRAARRARRGGAAHARASRSGPRRSRARTGCSSPTSSTRARPGTTGGSASPPPTPWIGQAINQAESLGFSKITGSIIPTSFDFYWQPPVHPVRSRPRRSSSSPRPGTRGASRPATSGATSRPPATAEAALNYLQAVGIRAKLRPLERAAFLKSYQEKKLKNLVYGLSGIGGNAATRIEAFTASTRRLRVRRLPRHRRRSSATRPSELDPKKREALLHRIQQLMHDKVMYLPIWQLSMLQGTARAWRSRDSASSPTTRGRRPTRTSCSSRGDPARPGPTPPRRAHGASPPVAPDC